VLYNALELTFQRRFGSLNVLGSYTGAKLLAGGNFQHQLLRNSRKALATQDRPHTFNLSYTYDLPFGRGRRFLNAGGVLNQIVGGWQLAAIHNYFAGFPVTVTSRATNPGVHQGAWPVLKAGVPIPTGQGCADYDPNNPAKNKVMNISAFSAPAPFSFGNVRTLPGTRDCGYLNENISVLKDFPIKESMRIRFGAEIFNLFNRHQWFGIQADVNNPAAFGRYSSASDPRTVQLQLKLEF